jgi:hypothetical protein
VKIFSKKKGKKTWNRKKNQENLHNWIFTVSLFPFFFCRDEGITTVRLGVFDTQQ